MRGRDFATVVMPYTLVEEPFSFYILHECMQAMFVKKIHGKVREHASKTYRTSMQQDEIFCEENCTFLEKPYFLAQ